MERENMKQKPGLVTSYLLPRLQDIFFIGILFFVCTQGFRLLNGDGDLGRHITIGNYVLNNWTIPTRDIFSHTMTGAYLVPHEWLAGVIFALATRLLGLNGDVLVAGIVISSAFTIVYKQTVDRGVFRLIALGITAWAALASFLHWLVRPHLFSFLFIAVWILILEKAVSNKKRNLWTLPVIMLIWANTHGGFFLGFLILGAYFTGWIWEYWQGRSDKETGIHLASVGILSFAVSFINPAGTHLWITSAGLIGKSFIINNTSEYLSPNFHITSTWPFLVMLSLGLVLSWNSNKLRMYELLLLMGWTILSLYMARNIPLYAIVTAPYLGVLIQPALDGFAKLKKINDSLTGVEINLKGIVFPILAIILITTAFLSGVRLDVQQRGNIHDPSRFPVDAVNWLEQNPQQGNMFNEFIWGGYLLYRLWPDQTIYMDGTTDFYGEAFTREYAGVVSLQDGWQDTLAKYNVSWAILPSNRPLIQALKDDLGWEIIYQDTTATIIRKPAHS
jgi:hypothetical protein